MGEFFEQLTWEATLAILGIFGILATTFLQLLRGKKDPVDLSSIETQISTLKTEMADVKGRIDVVDAKLESLASQDIDFKEIAVRLEAKIDKSNDLVIELFRTTNTN